MLGVGFAIDNFNASRQEGNQSLPDKIFQSPSYLSKMADYTPFGVRRIVKQIRNAPHKFYNRVNNIDYI